MTDLRYIKLVIVLRNCKNVDVEEAAEGQQLGPLYYPRKAFKRITQKVTTV